MTERFCEANRVSLVIRSHQFCRQGYKVMHSGRLITLFSARNYFQRGHGGKANDGAMLLLAMDDHGHLRVHPKRLEQYEQSARLHAYKPDDWRVKLVGSLAQCLQV